MTGAAFAAFVVYLIIFYFVNYYAATALLLVVLMFYLGVRSWKVLFLVPSGFLICSYYVFAVRLHVRL